MLQIEIDPRERRIGLGLSQHISPQGDDLGGPPWRQIEPPEELLPRALDGLLQRRCFRFDLRLVVAFHGSFKIGQCGLDSTELVARYFFAVIFHRGARGVNQTIGSVACSD